MGAFIQPCTLTNRAVREQYISTVANPVDLTTLKEQFRGRDVDEAIRLSEGEGVRFWGVVPGARNGGQFRNLAKGDLGLFTGDRMVHGSFRVLYKFLRPNEALARHLWGTQDKGRTRSLMYAISDVTPTAISSSRLREALGYQMSWAPRGFQHFDGPKAWRLEELVQSAPRQAWKAREQLFSGVGLQPASAPHSNPVDETRSPQSARDWLDQLERENVLAAIAEHDGLGEEAFLAKYGFARAVTYWLEYSGRRYSSKAIVGAAVGMLPDGKPLAASDFSGGEGPVTSVLHRLKFDVVLDGSDAPHASRNPKWTWSEEVLILEGYLRHGLVHAGSAEARALTDQLRELKVHSPKARGTDFRSAAEVARRLVELSKAAPNYDGEAGWFDYHDQAIWERLDTDLDTISELAAVVRGGAIIEDVDTDGTVTLVAPKPRKQAARKGATAPGPNIEGGTTTTTTKVRKGQSKLRDYLLAQIGSVCLFTGEGPRQALDAAHLYSFAESQTHDVYGAALMRADLHKLFDRREKTLPRPLISINPESWTVWVHPDVRTYEAYGLLHETEARGEWKDHIANEYLHVHYRQAIEGA